MIAFETLVVIMGARQAVRGLQPDEDWLVIATSDAKGSVKTVVAGVESEGHLYVSANHWFRVWYRRALANPDVEVTYSGECFSCRALPVVGTERERIASDYRIPWLVRFLTGFPPRSFLRLARREH